MRDVVRIHGIILIFQTSPGIERNVSLLQTLAVSVVVRTKGDVGKKVFIKPGGVKGASPKKVWGSRSGCAAKNPSKWG